MPSSSLPTEIKHNMSMCPLMCRHKFSSDMIQDGPATVKMLFSEAVILFNLSMTDRIFKNRNKSNSSGLHRV